MPVALARACSHYGCAHVAPCPDHGRKAQQDQYDRFRGTAASRGYDSRWTKHRAAFLKELSAHGIGPICGARLPGARLTTDSDCARHGYITPGRTADHIVPVTGPNDPTFWSLQALQFLCESCDARKRQRERRRA